MVAWVSLVSTAAVAISMGAYYQRRQLLRRLMTIFDILFLSGQATLAMLGTADVFGWDERCLIQLVNKASYGRWHRRLRVRFPIAVVTYV